MKYAVLPLLLSGLFLSGCNEESSSETTTNTVENPLPESCVKPGIYNFQGESYLLINIDTNKNGCLDQEEIDALPTPWNVSSTNIQTTDTSYAVITDITLTGTSDYVEASGIDGIQDGTPIAQLDKNDNNGKFKFKITSTHAEPRPEDAKVLMFFSNKSADFLINEGGSIGAGLENTGTSDINVSCSYDGTHTNLVCSGFTLNNSSKFTQIPVVGRLVVLSCTDTDSLVCKNGGDLYVQFN